MTKLERVGVRTVMGVVIAAALVLVGCAGSARAPITVVHQHDQGGEIALHGPIVAAHHAAEDAMVAHCQGRVEIVAVERGEDAVASADDGGVPRDAERMHYVCVSRARRAFASR